LEADAKRAAIEPGHPILSIAAQCQLLGLSRSGYYYEPISVSAFNLNVMRQIDELSTKYPFYGSRQMRDALWRDGCDVNRKRVQRLMRLMGIEAIYCKPKTTIPNLQHRVFPYLLRGVPITKTRQVWSIDITYIRMRHGFLYLVAVIDWFSRFVLSWELSNSMSVDFCIEALIKAFQHGTPEIFNSDQGAQFTAQEFVNELLSRNISVSMDGVGRAIDNVFVERLWRSVKYEEVYLKDYATGREAHKGIGNYFHFYNHLRPHSSLDAKTPAEVFIAA